MSKHYELNKLELAVDDYGFTLSVPNHTVQIKGEFNSSEIIMANKLPAHLTEFYSNQPGVVSHSPRLLIDSESENPFYLEVEFILSPGINWFEIDHTEFNRFYGLA